MSRQNGDQMPPGVPASPARTPWLPLFVINALEICVRGYGYNVNDQHLTLPAVKRLLDPTLYPNDFLFSKPLSDFSLYENVLYFPCRLLGVETAYLVVYVAVTFAISVAVYHLIAGLGGGRCSGILAAGLMCGTHTTRGELRTLVLDFYLYPRTVSLAFGAFALLFLMRRRWLWAAMTVGLTFVIHPPSALVCFTVLSVCLLREWAQSRIRTGQVLLAAMAFLVPASFLLGKMLLWRQGRGLEFFTPMDSVWYQIVRDRTDYMFYAEWALSKTGYLAFYAVVIWVSSVGLQPARRHLVRLVLCSVVGLNLLNFIARDLLHIRCFMQVHMEASVRAVPFLGLALAGHHVWQKLKGGDGVTQAVGVSFVAQLMLMSGGELWLGEGRTEVRGVLAWVCAAGLFAALEASRLSGERWRRSIQTAALGAWVLLAPLVALAAGGALSLVWALNRRGGIKPFPAAARGVTALLVAFAGVALCRSAVERGNPWHGVLNHIAVPHVRGGNPFAELATWMRQRTPPTAMFMGPLQLSGLRGAAERPYFVTYKDGGQVLYDRDYAIEWRERVDLVHQFSRKGAAHTLQRLAPQLGVSYLIANPAAPLSLPVVFRNEVAVVYDVRDGG